MKNKKKLYLVISIICFVSSLGCAVLYAFTEDKNVRFLSALGFSVCFFIFLKMFIDYLKGIGFGKRLFGPLGRFFARLYNGIADKIKYLTGYDEDKIYISPKKDEFQIKFEMFRAKKTVSEKKNKVKLPKYSSLTEEKEKIRYIYTVFLKKKIENGYKLDVSRTPDEISEDFASSEKAQALFAAYPVARYASDTEPLDVQSKQLEDIL